MIRIIKNPESKEYISKCHVCGCEFAYDISEIKNICLYDSPRSRYVTGTIDCPFCKTTIKWNESD